jgi:hypothetical protein
VTEQRARKIVPRDEPVGIRLGRSGRCPRPRPPAALGAVLTGVARALADRASVKAPPGRMADAAQWITAAAPAFTWPREGRGSFAEAYAANRAPPIRSRWTCPPSGRTCSASPMWASWGRRLNSSLGSTSARRTRRSAREWPKTAAAVGQHLARIAPNVRRLGYGDEQARTGRQRTWTITPRARGTGA